MDVWQIKELEGTFCGYVAKKGVRGRKSED
jgi:hypothetical protein